MFIVEVVRCSNPVHRIRALAEASDAIGHFMPLGDRDPIQMRAVRSIIPTPCLCHIESLAWLAAVAYSCTLDPTAYRLMDVELEAGLIAKGHRR